MIYDWRDDAACKGKPLDWFYPLTNESNEEAMAICDDCPVRQECLDYGVKHEEFGIWGGMTAKDRQRLRKQMQIELSEIKLEEVVTHPNCGTNAGWVALNRYFKERPHETRKMCPYCAYAHSEYNRRQILDEDARIRRQEYWRLKNERRRQKRREAAEGVGL